MYGKIAASVAAAIFMSATAGAEPASTRLLHPMFQDHAVLQRDAAVPLWGSARPGATVTVTLDGKSMHAKADTKGEWRVTLTPHTAGGPYELQVSSSDGQAISVKDVMLGDVWLCSGQSNMEFALRQVTNADVEIGRAADPGLRLFLVPRKSSPAPQRDFEGTPAWQVAAPETARDFSAACYFMGRDLRRDEKVPIGLIAASWGGSIIEDWISGPALRKTGGQDAALDLLARYAKDPVGAAKGWQDSIVAWADSHAGDKGWAAPDLDEGAWKPVPGPGIWEEWREPALARFDGIVWYRASVTLTPAQAQGAAALGFGAADDVDVSYVNGEAVGADMGWNKPRHYQLRSGLLKPGRNVVAIRVIDTGGGGGFSGAAPALTLSDGTRVPLQDWRYRMGASIEQTSTPPRLPWNGGSGLSTLFNGMIAPVAPYALKGFAWYQGESNTGDAPAYAKLLPALMADWRTRFSAAPFMIVQLANYGPASDAPGNSGWPQLREVQRRVAAGDGKAAVASAIDIGDRYDIHPTNKQEVGRRLALAAQSIAYGRTVATSGPAPRSALWEKGSVAVRFGDVSERLQVQGGARALGFELCEADGKCRFADAAVEGDSAVIDAPTPPARVRYLWADSPVVNLYDASGRPALPFELTVDRAGP